MVLVCLVCLVWCGVLCCSILGGFIVLVCLVWFGGVLCSVLGGVW